LRCWPTLLAGLLLLLPIFACSTLRQKEGAAHGAKDPCLAPIAVATASHGTQLLVAGAYGQRAFLLDRETGELGRTIRLPADSTGVAVRNNLAFFTTSEPAGRVLVVDLDTGTIRRELRAGHTPMAPVLSSDGHTLLVANRFNNNVGLIDLETGVMRTVAVVREPVAMALSPDGRRLFVANHLPEVRLFEDEDNPIISAEVSAIDLGSGRLLRNIALANGSQSARGIAVSPDGRWVAVTHVLSHYLQPAWEVANGAMNRNAVSLLDAVTLECVATVPLDDPALGAGNPWGVAFSADGRRLLVTHAGTHELSLIDFPALQQRLAARTRSGESPFETKLTLLEGIRRRVPLGIRGPRALAVVGDVAYVAGYFSDTLAVVDFRAAEPATRQTALGPPVLAPLARRGEEYFHDASLCFQGWQSCSSCHPDGRSDTLYWDLLNDGLGNTKNTSSLLMSALTPPVMWLGVRADAATAIRAGIEHIEFATPQPGEVEAIEAYLRQMPVVPSPYLDATVLETPKTDNASCAKCHYPGVQRGTLTDSAQRGKSIFEGKAGCVACHPHPTFTTRQRIDPGLGAGIEYRVPSLVECWRTAPYLHNGDALTLRETITDYNHQQKRGNTRDLSEAELNDLLEYLRSL